MAYDSDKKVEGKLKEAKKDRYEGFFCLVYFSLLPNTFSSIFFNAAFHRIYFLYYVVDQHILCTVSLLQLHIIIT